MIVTQRITSEEIENLKRQILKKRYPAFNQWLGKLNSNDRLPRGRFFIGKRPRRIIIDEAWQLLKSQ